MKQYVISEEELRRISDHVVVGDWIDKYIKSKKPVEMIASGSVNHSQIQERYYVGETSINVLLSKFYGKSIKIFIQEE